MWTWILGAIESWKAWRRVPDANVAAEDSERVKFGKWWEANRHRVSDGTADTGPQDEP